jgi:hypothetical protein
LLVAVAVGNRLAVAAALVDLELQMDLVLLRAQHIRLQ